jgi:hypothetical protein
VDKSRLLRSGADRLERQKMCGRALQGVAGRCRRTSQRGGGGRRVHREGALVASALATSAGRPAGAGGVTGGLLPSVGVALCGCCQ